MQQTRKRLVVICPVFNEEKNVDYFFGRLREVFAAVDASRYDCSLLFTNNRSVDTTLERIRAVEVEHPWVSHLTLSRNFGYQLSVLSGLTIANKADLYMICDVDCEDPPEMLLAFLREIEAGRDLAYGIRNNRPDSWLMMHCRRAFYLLLCKLGDYTIIPYMAEFGMFRRTVRDAVIGGPNTFPFLRAEVGYVGFNIAGLPYRREDRKHGVTHYNYFGNFKFAIAGILSSTTFPLRAALYSLPLILFLNLVLFAMGATRMVSFAAAALPLLAMNGMFSATAIAFQSIYLARTYQNGLGRRRFIVDPALTAVAPELFDPTQQCHLLSGS
jgi:polyisoprenyl-phosphate glycosyltransferase